MNVCVWANQFYATYATQNVNYKADGAKSVEVHLAQQLSFFFFFFLNTNISVVNLKSKAITKW